MQIIAQCPICKISCLLDGDYADRRVKCIKCKKRFRIPKLEEVPNAKSVIEEVMGTIYVDQKGKIFG